MLTNRPDDASQARIYWEEALSHDIPADAIRPHINSFHTIHLQMPLSLLKRDLLNRHSSKSFIEEEIEIFREAGHDDISGFYQSLIDNTHTGVPPIVCGAYLIKRTIRIHLWDGWHRSSAANATDKQTIDAVIAYDPSLQKRLMTEIARHSPADTLLLKKAA